MGTPDLRAGTAVVGLSRRHRRWILGGLLFTVGTAIAVIVSDEVQHQRRHKGIAKDIERERFRREQLGLPPDSDDDDGFAERYLRDPANARVAADARAVMEANRRLAARPREA